MRYKSFNLFKKVEMAKFQPGEIIRCKYNDEYVTFIKYVHTHVEVRKKNGVVFTESEHLFDKLTDEDKINLL